MPIACLGYSYLEAVPNTLCSPFRAMKLGALLPVPIIPTDRVDVNDCSLSSLLPQMIAEIDRHGS